MSESKITASRIFGALGHRGFFNWMSDERYLKILWKLKFGTKLDLENPQTFNEKLQWLKIHNRKPEYTTMVDKYEAKKYVAEKIGEEYIIPTLGVWDRFDDIDFDKLPNQFVLKCTHNSGGIVICKDKSKLDKKNARKLLTKCLKNNFYYGGREWPYKNVKPRIIAEKYMVDDSDKELRDYKLYCFNGYTKATLLATNRQSSTEELAFDYFDNKFDHMELTNHWHPNAKKRPHKPINYAKMVELSSVLSRGIPHLRVDFYEVNGKIYFGELTFFDMSGFLKIHPDDWELEWGKLIDLSLCEGNKHPNE